MKGFSLSKQWMRLTPNMLPFADAATDELPLSRLLRLSLFQISVGMAAVLLIGTLNRVMIVELQVPAGLVAVMVALPLVFAPLRALIGFRSDNYASALGWRRVPYIWFGTIFQFSGFAMMPFALILLSGDTTGPMWAGQVAAAISFLLVGAGMHMVQTAGLALATDIAPPKVQAKVVALLSVMFLLGMLLSSIVFGALLTPFSQIKLIQVIQGAAAITMVINFIAVWKQEPRVPNRNMDRTEEPSFIAAWRKLRQPGPGARRVLATATLVLGAEHPDTLATAGNLAQSLSRQGKYADAERIEREVLGVRRRVLGEEHPETLLSTANLATTLARQAKFTEAEEMLQATLEAYRRVLGDTQPDTVFVAQSLENVRSCMRAEQPTRTVRKAAVRRTDRAATPALSPTALAEAETRARAAEAELLAMLDLEEPEAGAGSGSGKGKGKGKAKGRAPKAKGGGR
ncbi:MAG: MFS transporter [Roseococcus sp.]